MSLKGRSVPPASWRSFCSACFAIIGLDQPDETVAMPPLPCFGNRITFFLTADFS